MPIEKVLEDIKFRDKTDYDRKEGPLKRAKDAILIDTSSLTIDQTVDKILQLTNRTTSQTTKKGHVRKGRKDG